MKAITSSQATITATKTVTPTEHDERGAGSSLARLGGALVTAAGGGALLDRRGARAATRPSRSGAVACVLTPELTEGPVLHRGREGAPRHPGRAIPGRLLDAAPPRPRTRRRCKPIKGAAVDIWHADAAGNYSGFGAGPSSRTFLRGIQKTERRTVSPSSRRSIRAGTRAATVHIHVKVHVGGGVVHTGQLFFTDALTDAVYKARRTPHAATRNTERARLDLRERRQAQPARSAEERRGLHRHDRHGRPQVGACTGGGVHRWRRAQGRRRADLDPRPPSAHFRNGGCRRAWHCGTAGVHDRRGGRSEAVSFANRDSTPSFPAHGATLFWRTLFTLP